MEQFHGTTIVSVRRGNQVCIGGDGQVTLGNTVMKGTPGKSDASTKIRYWPDSRAEQLDAFTLFERFDGKLEKHQGNLTRAAVELAKDWRQDRMLRRLEAILAVADTETSLIITGNGDVMEPENGIIAVGSGGPFAQAAALALIRNTKLPARTIVEEALKAAGDICIYTNTNFTIDELTTNHD